MKVEKISITYGDKTDSVHVRTLNFLKRAQMFTDYRGDAVVKDDGTVDIKAIPLIRSAQLTVGIIVNSVCDAKGKTTLTVEEVCDWEDEKRIAYESAIFAFQNPTVEAVAKNS